MSIQIKGMCNDASNPVVAYIKDYQAHMICTYELKTKNNFDRCQYIFYDTMLTLVLKIVHVGNFHSLIKSCTREVSEYQSMSDEEI